MTNTAPPTAPVPSSEAELRDRIDRPASGAPGPDDRAYAWFSGAIASWFASFGIQSTLFSWLLVGELGVSDEWMGVAQTSHMLPAILLLLLGGAAADRIDPRRMLIVLHGVGTLPVLALAVVVASGVLTIPIVIAFGVSMGVVSALSMPARDTLLSRVAGDNMMRAVTGMTAVQFGSQALGALVAGAARWVGSAPMLVAQATVLLMGSFSTMKVPAESPAPRHGSASSPLRDIADGLRQVARNEQLWSPLMLVFSVGFLFVGPFLVTFPIIVTRIFGGSISDLAIVLTMFPLGAIVGSLFLRWRGLRRKGRAALIALVFGAVALAVVGLGISLSVMVVASLAWGLGGAVFINCSRTLYQEAAPPTQRGRVLAVYQLGFMGAAPLGSISAGFVSGQIGPLATLHVYAVVMLLAVIAVWIFTDLARME
ncbi:MAG: MFS transporter [Myxococcota bacterium]